jgi:hypothetical protein
MNITSQNEQPAILQSTEAIPLEDRSLPADEVLTAQQSDFANYDSSPVFVP